MTYSAFMIDCGNRMDQIYVTGIWRRAQGWKRTGDSAMPQKIRVAAVQMKCLSGDVAYNLDFVRANIFAAIV